MSFIEFEKSIKNTEWSMNDLHSHSHYEIYFLLKGERTFFLSNALFKLNKHTLVVIPPFEMHKTEGGPFERFNINVSPDYLDPFQKETLDNSTKFTALEISDDKMAEFNKLIKKIDELPINARHDKHIKKALFSYVIFLISEINNKSKIKEKIGNDLYTPPVILKTIEYISEHYAETINLNILSDMFFLSKTSLCKQFKKATNCSIIDFLLNIRLGKAKNYLSTTNKSMSEISDLCGFCSENYFGLIFKKKIGLSPSQYRKHQHNKQ